MFCNVGGIVTDLLTIIFDLVALGREGEYWDYKEQYNECKAELLHDIICFANSLARGDKYIILGVENSGEIVGIENDQNRKKQSDIIDFLRSKKFAGEYRPEVELHTLYWQNHEIDVIIIKNTSNTPYYLVEDYNDKKSSRQIIVHANHIYSRICDTNTPINSSADLYVIEKLWRRRFGLDLTPLERVNILLENTDDWDIDIGNREYGFCKIAPEYRVVMTDLESCTEPCGYFYLDGTPCMGRLKILYHSTILHEGNYWGFDGARLIVPEFELSYIRVGNGMHYFYYYVVDSLGGRLLKLFTSGTYDLSSRYTENCFIIFNDEKEVCDFKQYAESNYDRVQDIPTSPMCNIAMTNEEKVGKMGITAEDAWRVKQLHQMWEVDRIEEEKVNA